MKVCGIIIIIIIIMAPTSDFVAVADEIEGWWFYPWLLWCPWVTNLTINCL